MIHALFEALALFVGVQYYRHLRRQACISNGAPNGNAASSRVFGPGVHWPLALGCIFGAALGAKTAFWLEVPHLFTWSQFLNGGRTIVGGLLGGLIGVEVTKWFSGVRHSTGDDFVYPVLLGIMIGRIGCYFAGLPDATYGTETTLPWGVDFGDGLLRHPTQLYEILFAAILWKILAHYAPRLDAQPGLRFKWMLCAYLLWRFAIDAIKPVPFAYFGHLSGIQVLCAFALCLYLPFTLQHTLNLRHAKKPATHPEPNS